MCACVEIYAPAAPQTVVCRQQAAHSAADQLDVHGATDGQGVVTHKDALVTLLSDSAFAWSAAESSISRGRVARSRVYAGSCTLEDGQEFIRVLKLITDLARAAVRFPNFGRTIPRVAICA